MKAIAVAFAIGFAIPCLWCRRDRIVGTAYAWWVIARRLVRW